MLYPEVFDAEHVVRVFGTSPRRVHDAGAQGREPSTAATAHCLWKQAHDGLTFLQRHR